MSWYRTGTVNVTNNSDVVVGTGTDWLNAAKTGDMFQGPDLVSYEILQIASPTSLRCYPAYRGPTSVAQNYAIIPTRSRDVETAAGVSQLINNYAGVRDNAGTGKFAVGAAGAPSLRGLEDQDTGINFPGGNLLDLYAGGVLQLGIDALGGVRGQAVEAIVNQGSESGSNGVGSYWRFASGLQICRRRYTQNVNVPAGGGVVPSGDTAASFSEPPAIYAAAVFYEGVDATGEQLYSSNFGFMAASPTPSIINTGRQPSLSNPSFTLGDKLAQSVVFDLTFIGRYK